MRLNAGSIMNEKNKLNIAEYDIDPLTYFDLGPLVPLVVDNNRNEVSQKSCRKDQNGQDQKRRN